MQKQQTTSIVIAILLIVAAAISRVIMYPNNFSPMVGMAIFSGAIVKDKRLAFALPIFSMFLSDVMFEVFNIAPGFWGWAQLGIYAAFAIITILAFSLKKINVLTVAGYSLGASVLFYFLSNSAVFFISNPVYHSYPQTFDGYVQCMTAGLPFLWPKNIIADLVYSGVLFGAYYLVQNVTVKKEAVV